MDSNGAWGYKCATLFDDECGSFAESIRERMDREFLTQIDQVREILPDGPAELLDDEILICECFCVNVKDIRQSCAEAQKVDIRLLQDQLSLGHGCQNCLKTIECWINKIF